MCSPLLICTTSIASRCANTDQCSLFGHIPLLTIRQKKRRGNRSVAHPTSKGSRIARYYRTSNADSPRRYEYSFPLHIKTTTFVIVSKGMRINTSRGHLPLPCPDNIVRTCEILGCQRQDAWRRLFNMSWFLLSPTLPSLLRQHCLTRLGVGSLLPMDFEYVRMHTEHKTTVIERKFINFYYWCH